MVRGKILLLVVVMAAGLVGWMWLREEADAPGSIEPGAVTPAPVSEPLAAEPAGGAASDEVVDGRVAVSEPASVATAAQPAGDGMVELSGTFVVVDRDGVEHPAEDGEFSFYAWQGNTGTSQDVSVTAGTWRVRMERPEGISLDTATLGGRALVCPTERIDLPAGEWPPDHRIELRGVWVATLTLRVVAEDSGLDLSGVKIVTSMVWGDQSYKHPGAIRSPVTVVENGSSPVRFEPLKGGDSRTYWVTAPGHAWGRLKMSLTDTSERVVRLPAGGGLTVSVDGVKPPPRSVIRVHEATGTGEQGRGGVPLAEYRLRSGKSVSIDGLPVGDYWVLAQIGKWFDSPKDLGSARATVAANETRQVVVTLTEEVRELEHVPLSGTLHLPEEWSRTGVYLEIEPSGDLRARNVGSTRIQLAEMEPISAEEYAWDAGTQVVGDYQALVGTCELRTRFRVPAGGLRDQRFEVPPPETVRVRVLDAETGQVIPDANPGWYTNIPGWEGGWAHASMAKIEDGLFEFQAAPGEVTISVHTEGYGWASVDWNVRAGLNEVRLECQRACGVEVFLLDGEAVLPWEFGNRVSLKCLDGGDGRAGGWSGRKVSATKPGRYELSIADVEGFESVEPREVTIDPGSFKRVEIPLTRK